jgi:mRNA interferase MazF
MRIYKGDIFYADLTPVVGCEQGGIRPVLIIQNNIGNRYSPTVIVAAITSRTEKNPLPTHIQLHSQQYGLRQNSLVLLEQVRTIDRSRLHEYIGHLDISQIQLVDEALIVSFGLNTRLQETQTESMTIASSIL